MILDKIALKERCVLISEILFLQINKKRDFSGVLIIIPKCNITRWSLKVRIN